MVLVRVRRSISSSSARLRSSSSGSAGGAIRSATGASVDLVVGLDGDRLGRTVGLGRQVRGQVGHLLAHGASVAPSVSATSSAAAVPGSAWSTRRRPPPAVIRRRGRLWPEVSPTAMAASRVILSSIEIL